MLEKKVQMEKITLLIRQLQIMHMVAITILKVDTAEAVTAVIRTKMAEVVVDLLI